MMKEYEVVRRRYGKLYAAEYVSSSVGMTLYVSESQNEAETMYRKLDAMTPAQMKDYINMR